MSRDPADTDAPPPAAKTRRATRWVDPDVPGWADFAAGGERRARFWRFWSGPGRSELQTLITRAVFSKLPIRWVSGLGDLLGHRVILKSMPDIVIAARQRLRHLNPEWTEAEVEAAVARFCAYLGRQRTEYAVADRMAPAGYLTDDMPVQLAERLRAGPTICLMCHTGNFEVMLSAYRRHGLAVTQVIAPPVLYAERRIAEIVRAAAGIRTVTAGHAGTRELLRVLKAGGAISIAVDEVHDGRVQGPFFDRPPHLNGNYAIVARLSRMTGATLVLFANARRDGPHQHVRIIGPLTIPSQTDPNAALIDDVVALNAIVEPHIRAHLDQWFFLNHPW